MSVCKEIKAIQQVLFHFWNLFACYEASLLSIQILKLWEMARTILQIMQFVEDRCGIT